MSDSLAQKTGRLVVLSGPAGAGKTTVAERVCLETGAERSVSVTTRERRPGEEHGVDYTFLGEAEFRERIARGDLLEYAEVHGNLYGTPRSAVEEAVAAGRTILLVIDVQGAMQVKEHCPEAVFVFLDAPDEATLGARLEGRSTETESERQRRLAAADAERQYKEHYDYHVTNDDLDRTVAEVSAIVRSGRKPEHRRPRLDG